MTRRTIFGACVLCALVCGAIVAPGASATPSTTAFTCEKESGGTFADPHCTVASVGGAFKHVEIPVNTSTELTGTNANSCEETKFKCPVEIKSKIGALTFTLVGAKLSVNGTLANSLIEKEHLASGENTITVEEVVVVSPVGTGCEVKGFKIVSNPLTVTTKEQGMALKFAPKEGTTFASFVVQGCSNAILNRNYELTGSVQGIPNGATVGFTHTATTEPKSLRLKPLGFPAEPAGIETTITLAAKGTPVAFTTVT